MRTSLYASLSALRVLNALRLCMCAAGSGTCWMCSGLHLSAARAVQAYEAESALLEAQEELDLTRLRLDIALHVGFRQNTEMSACFGVVSSPRPWKA